MTPASKKETVQEAVLALIQEKFPEARVKIRQLYQQSPSFQTLCEDYRDCLAAWQHWQQAASEEAPAVCRSYAELLGELEEEMRQYFELAKA